MTTDSRDRREYHRLRRQQTRPNRVCSCWDAVEDPTCKIHGYIDRPSRPIPRAYKRYPPGKLPPHGTTARYYRGCKCIPCLDAKAKHQREKRKRERGADWVDKRYKPIEHGTPAGSRRCKPICEPCRLEKNRYARLLYNAKKLARDLERYREGCREAQQVLSGSDRSGDCHR